MTNFIYENEAVYELLHQGGLTPNYRYQSLMVVTCLAWSIILLETVEVRLAALLPLYLTGVRKHPTNYFLSKGQHDTVLLGTNGIILSTFNNFVLSF